MRKHGVPLFIGLLGAGLVWVSTSLYGVGMTTVSGDYVSAARSLLAEGTFVQHDGRPFIEYPPFYSMTLAAVGAFGMDPQDGARWLNAVFLGLLMFVSCRWLARRLQSAWVATLGSLMILVSVPLLAMSVAAFPETLFMILVLLTALSAARYADTGARGAYAAAAVFAALACLTRYMGVTAVAVGCALVFARGGKPVGARVLRAAAFAVLALIPTVMWLARNAAVAGSLAGNRGPSVVPFFDNAWYALRIISLWALPEQVPDAARVGAVVVLGLFALGWIAQRPRGDEPPGRSDVNAMALFAALYVAATVAALSVVALDRMNTRYLIPAYVPALLVLLAAIDGLHARLRGGVRRVAAYAMAAAMAVWVLAMARYEARAVLELRRDGAGGYSTRLWHDAATVAALRARAPAGLVYSNDAYGVHVVTGIPARPSPRRHRFNSPASTTADLEEFAAVVDSARAVHLVWLDFVNRDYIYTESDLAAVFRLELSDSTRDGRVYRVAPR